MSAINRVIDDFHHAASVADEAAYFGHMAPEFIFLGTDATGRHPPILARLLSDRPAC